MSGGFLALQARRNKEKKKPSFDLEEAFKAADSDKDGKLTLDKWYDVLNKTGHNVSKSDVAELFRDNACSPDGKLSYSDFVAQETKSGLAFKALDTNGDGYVSFSEFRKICPNMTKEQAEAAFAKFDLDKTGKISSQEFAKMLNKSSHHHQKSS